MTTWHGITINMYGQWFHGVLPTLIVVVFATCTAQHLTLAERCCHAKKKIAEHKGAGTNAATRPNIIIGEELSGILF